VSPCDVSAFDRLINQLRYIVTAKGESQQKNMVCAACYALCRVLVEAEGMLLHMPREAAHICILEHL
jgi:hypothetical protein